MDNQDKYIRINEVMTLSGLAKSTIYKWQKEGKFPPSISLSRRVSVWKLSTIERFIASGGIVENTQMA